MNTLQLNKEFPDPLPVKSYRSEKTTALHRCPVCSTVHEVSPARAQFAYGRQLSCNPDCEAERRRRNRESYRLARASVPGRCLAPVGRVSRSLRLVSPPAPSATAVSERNADRPSALRLVPGAELKAALLVTVESTDVLPMRMAIFQSGDDSVDILKVTPVPHSSRVRLLVGMKAGAVKLIMSAIMRSVPSGELGRVSAT